MKKRAFKINKNKFQRYLDTYIFKGLIQLDFDQNEFMVETKKRATVHGVSCIIKLEMDNCIRN